MVPLGALLSSTGPLQLLVASVVHKMCTLVGLGIERDGIKLLSSDPVFFCEVAGGCSGIRSIMAMTMLSAVYVHFTQKELWKKVVIFAFTLPFAVLGNIFRVFTIVLVARFISVSIGTGPYHDISGFLVTIPIAVWAMVTLGNLLNRDWSSVARKALAPAPPVATEKGRPDAPTPISYDY
jgi:exosortase